MNPLYKVFLVEDEIVTREGIRDNVNWNAHGFQFCGEAPDGEVALSLLETAQPDVIITDIKMPFMDGLELVKIVRERMPRVKIIILSGHDEFEYAHQAIQLGVKEYLLKPVTVESLQQVLDRMVVHLDQEREKNEQLRTLQAQVEENKAVLRERFLLKLVVGVIPFGEAMEKSQQLGLNLVARYYQVVLIKTELADRSEQFDYDEYVLVQQMVSNIIGNNPDIFLLKKDWEEFVLLFKGNTAEFVEEEKDLLLDRIREAVGKTRYSLNIGCGTSKNRMTFIYQSFIEALDNLQHSGAETNTAVADDLVDQKALFRLEKDNLEDFLKCGVKEDVASFFDAYIKPLGLAALQSSLIKNYLFMDIIWSTTRFISDLGGDVDEIIPELQSIEKVLLNIKTVDQLKAAVNKILTSALLFRDQLTSSQYANTIKQAKIYINNSYQNPDLGLNDVANHVNLSPSHFSVIFSQENCQTFKEYLTEIRIQKAKELLRTTPLGANEISEKIGYNDPHYFSYVFKKNTGVSPTEFRQQAQSG